MHTTTNHGDTMSQSQKSFDEDHKAEEFAEKMLENMCSPQIDSAYAEDIWEEINLVLSIENYRERMDAIEDTTLISIMKKAVKRRVKAMIERGGFQ